MPIYEYACHQCGHEFEALVRQSTVPECPDCHGTDLEKLLSVFATPTASAGATRREMGPCGSCGHPDGPGACGIH